MRNRYSIFLVVVLLIVVMMVPGCGRKNPRYRIGVSQCSGDYWRVKTNEDIQRELLLHDDIEVEFRSAESDNERQIADVKYFIDNKYDLIIVSPNEADPLTPIIEDAIKKGIPVVTFDRKISGDSFTAHMEVDNYALGQSVASYAGSRCDKPIRAIEIQGPASASPAVRRHEGFISGIAQIPDARILASVYANWSDSLSQKLVDSLLNIFPETNLIYAHTDHMAIGASRAVRDKGRGDIAIMGIDGFPNIGVQAVKDGKETATFLYPTEGERLLRLAVAILKKEPFERINEVAPLSPIDRSNADILLAQDSLLRNETGKVNFLRERLDEYWNRYSMQKALLSAMVIILVLLAGFVFLMFRWINANKRYQKTLLNKNVLLEKEKKKQEELYIKLGEATQAKLMFFTNVSHDLRTPLTLIAAPVDKMVNAEYLKPRDREMMKMARKNVNILQRLINQILDFRIYENGKSDMHLSEVALGRLVEGWTDAFREIAVKRDISLKCHIKKQDSFDMGVDVEKLERVFFNLMSNAFKHTPDNGHITVTLEREEDKAILMVKDSGTGISEEDCRHIFERFFQADNGNSRGSGIGLALTKAFVELHGGSIGVKSRKGEGSEFIVTLPVKHCDNKSDMPDSHINAEDINKELMPIEKDSEEFDTTKPLMLVVDDNRDIQRLISDILGEGYNLIYASDGMQGVKMAVKYIPDIIICDVMMPVMDGMECVKRIKDDIATSHIPVLMLTACSLDEQRAKGYRSGADGYLSKPFDNAVLIARCQNLLENRKRIQELYSGVHVKKYASPSLKKEVNTINVAPNDVESDFYSSFVKNVTDRLGDAKLSVEEIAGKMGLSQSQLTRKIKALTNYAPVEIIRTLRLYRARTLINGSEKTISEIAFEVGFSSLAYFSRCYKEEFGVTPSEVRIK